MYRRLWVVIVCVVLTVGAAVAIVRLTPPVYRASSTLTFDKTPPIVLITNPGGANVLGQQPAAQAPDIPTLIALMKSQEVLAAAADRLAPTLNPRAANDILNDILGHIQIQQVDNTDIVRISAEDTNAQAAAAVANAVAQGVIETDLNARRRLVTQTREFISVQLQRAAERLQASEDALVAFKDQHGVALSEKARMDLQMLSNLEGQLMTIQLQKHEPGSGFAYQGVAAQQGGDVPSHVSADPLIASLRDQLATLEIQLSGLSTQFTPAHPAVISTESRIEKTKRSLAAEIARDQAVLDNRGQELSDAISQVEQELHALPAQEAALADLVRTSQEAERGYTLLSEKLMEARVAEGSIGSPIRVADKATVPTAPEWPKPGLTAMLSVIVGLVVGMAGALGMEQLDHTVKSAEELEQLVGAPVLGTIPRMTTSVPLLSDGRAGPILTEWVGGSVAAGAFRALRTRILRVLRDSQNAGVLITSATSGEGKSTIAINLAVALAQAHRRVVLVDCDLRHTTLRNVFPQIDSPGLSTVLDGRAAVDDVIRPISHTGVQGVASGPVVADPGERLDSPSMAQIMTDLRQRGDIILLDSPAVLPVTDVEALGMHVTAALVVVRAGRADARDVIRACRRLERTGVCVIGTVFNNVASRRRS